MKGYKSKFHLDEDKSDTKKKIEEVRARAKEREVEDFKKVLSNPEGRRFIWKIMSEAGVFRTSFTGNSETFFNEGKRSMGLMVLEEVMKADPGKFTQMQNEFTNEQKKIAKQLENINDSRN